MDVKLQSAPSRKYKSKRTGKVEPYPKFWVVIPNNLIKEMGWKAGDEIEQTPSGAGLILTKQKK